MEERWGPGLSPEEHPPLREGKKSGGGETPVRKPTGTTGIRKKNRKADAPEARVISQF